MFNELLENSYNLVGELPCCHQDGRNCNCSDCLQEDFYRRPDNYECRKKLAFYIAKYSSAHCNEFFSYLVQSRIINQFNNTSLRVLSLGCGYGPDYYAISKYIENENINTHLEYTGFDNNPLWLEVSNQYMNQNFQISDLSEPFDINGFDIIIINKVFSTLLKHDLHNRFLGHLFNAIDITGNNPLIIVFSDVNDRRMGRDAFDSRITPKFTEIRRFYTRNSTYIEETWQMIESRMVFPIIPNPRIDPHNQIRKTVYFEYRK